MKNYNAKLECNDKDMHYKNAIIATSVYNEKCSGKKLRATITKCKKIFKTSHIIVGDLLQRHNIQADHPEMSSDVCMSESQKIGDGFLKNNSDELKERAKRKSCIVRWKELLCDQACLNQLDEMREAYNTNPHFKDAVDETASNFIERNIGKNHAASVKYIIEELAFLLVYARRNQCHYIVYPNPIPSAISAMRDIFLNENEKHLLQWVEITHYHPRTNNTIFFNPKTKNDNLESLAASIADQISDNVGQERQLELISLVTTLLCKKNIYKPSISNRDNIENTPTDKAVTLCY